jgi:hypothetical protein
MVYSLLTTGIALVRGEDATGSNLVSQQNLAQAALGRV